MVLGDSVRHCPSPPGKDDGALGDLLLILWSALVAEGVPSSAFDELADFIGQAAADDLPVFLFMKLAVFLEIGQEFEAADATFDDAGGVLANGEVVEMVHSFRMSLSPGLSAKMARGWMSAEAGLQLGIGLRRKQPLIDTDGHGLRRGDSGWRTGEWVDHNTF